MSDKQSIFLDLFIYRMNMKESQGVEKHRPKMKLGVIKNGKSSSFATRGSFLPERKQWKQIRTQHQDVGLKTRDYEQEIDRHMDLIYFEKLVSLYVIKKKSVPSLRMLSNLIRGNRSLDNQRKLAQRMRKAWQEALEDFEIQEYNSNRLATAKEGTEGLLSAPAKVKKRKRPLPEDVANRRGAVRAVEKSNPRLKGKNLDWETCIHLDSQPTIIPVRENWRDKYKVNSWKEGYQHNHVKGLIHRMFSNDRKVSF
jgi:hypothetical protein